MVCDFAPRSKFLHKKVACELYSDSSICKGEGPVNPLTGEIYCGRYRELVTQKETGLVSVEA